MHHYSHKKGNSSFLSTSPFSYVAESVTESPLFIGYSWESYILKPLAAYVKTAFSSCLVHINRLAVSVITAPLFNILQNCNSTVTGNTKESSFPYKKTAHTDGIIGNACAVRQQRPILKPEQTGNVATSYARKLFIAEEAHCERLSYILKQCAQTLANSLLLGIINLCSSFWRKHCPNMGASFPYIFLRPLSFPRTGVRRIATVNSVASLIYYEKPSLAPLLENNQKFTIKKGTKCVCF